MATASRHQGVVIEQGIGLESDGAEFRMLREMLQDEPFRVHFFQAVRMLERMEKQRGGVGYFAQPREEAVRFTTKPSLSFPPSEIYDLERMPSGQLNMTVQFMGLCAALSALPSIYTEAVMVRLREKDGAMAEFFDIFNHRLISFFYRAWEKNHFFVGLEAGKDDPLSLRMLDVFGPWNGGHAQPGRNRRPDVHLLCGIAGQAGSYGGFIAADSRGLLRRSCASAGVCRNMASLTEGQPNVSDGEQSSE